MEKELLFQGKKVSYYMKGKGPTVVFLHGFLENKHIWDCFVEMPHKHFSCLSIDLPGFGQTEVFSENHTMDFMAQVVKAVTDAENIDSIILTGHSMGGYVSLAFAAKYSEKLKGLVLFHSQAAADDKQGKQNRNRTIDIVKRNHKDFISNFIPLLFAEKNVEKFSKEIKQLKKASLETSAEGVIAALAGMRDRNDSCNLLETLAIPVFFVVGKNDRHIPLQKIILQLSLPSHSECLILDTVGHIGFVEAPEKIFPVLTDFFNRYIK